MSATHLLIQPGAGIAPLLDGLEHAEQIVQIVIFRFDRGEIEAALKRAVRRGVFVHALVAHTMAGQGGASTLRKLEMRLLADGVTVARTASDLVRYHDKLMIVDKRTLFLLGFNFTYIDVERSRSFGIVTTNRAWVREAEKLFIADSTRQQYTPECDTFLVSPGNSRRHLMTMLESARRQLMIYDGKLSDPDVMRLLSAKAREGVDVRVIGSAGKRAVGIQVAPLHMRLHAQAVVRDGEQLFLGSQSLRSLELDARREVGVLIDDPAIIGQVVSTFEADWAKIRNHTELRHPERTETSEAFEIREAPAAPSVQVVKSAVKEAIKDALMQTGQFAPAEAPLKEAVKDAAREALSELGR